jgi:predicted Zn-dependent protease
MQHTAQVTKFFRQELAQPERLCSVDIRDGNVGERICSFLGHSPMCFPKYSGRPSNTDLDVNWRWLELCPDKSEAHYSWAKKLQHAGYLKKAEHHLNIAIEIEPGQPKPYAKLSDLLWQQGRLSEAFELAYWAVNQGMLSRRLCYRAAMGTFIQSNWGKTLELLLRGVQQKRN